MFQPEPNISLFIVNCRYTFQKFEVSNSSQLFCLSGKIYSITSSDRLMDEWLIWIPLELMLNLNVFSQLSLLVDLTVLSPNLLFLSRLLLLPLASPLYFPFINRLGLLTPIPFFLKNFL